VEIVLLSAVTLALHRNLVQKGLRPTTPKDADWGERDFEIPDPQGAVISCAEVIS
jgi:hypothetical protein